MKRFRWLVLIGLILVSIVLPSWTQKASGVQATDKEA